MGNVTNKAKRFQLLTLLIPLLLSALFAIFESVIAAVLWPISVILVIILVPAFDKRENLWTFLCVALSGIPANVYIIGRMMEWAWVIIPDAKVFYILYMALFYSLLFSIEEIVFGTVIRFFYPRQYKLNI